MKREKTRKRKKILITTLFPSIEETARRLHIPKKRVGELEKIFDEIWKKDEEGKKRGKKS